MLREHRRLGLAMAAAGLLHALVLSLVQSDRDHSISSEAQLEARWWPSIGTIGSHSSRELTPEQQYIERWRTTMERFATRHFPVRAIDAAVRQAPVLEVVVRTDGTLAELRIRRSSGDRQLDRAALDLVREAAPFESFSAPLATRRQSLRFAYEWRFETGERNR